MKNQHLSSVAVIDSIQWITVVCVHFTFERCGSTNITYLCVKLTEFWLWESHCLSLLEAKNSVY
jgi:hypothetical protein